MKTEEIVFRIISYSGDAKAYCFEALDACKNKDFEKSEELIKKAKEELLKAHNVQTKLIQDEASGIKCDINLLMVHAQDHLMNASLTKDLIVELIELYKK